MKSPLFSVLPLSAALTANLESLNYRQMTPIQEQSLPPILDGLDLIAKAKTGSGKTAAFGIGLITKLNPGSYAPQALVLCPTRELGAQTAGEIRRLARFLPNVKVLTLCGGQPIGPQIGSLEHGADILVGTPGRLIDHLSRRTLSLKQIKTLVLDEADRMLEMGFYDDIKKIIQQIPNQRQTLLFSATYPDRIRQLSADFQKSPVEVRVDELPSGELLEQIFYEVGKQTKQEALIRLLARYRPSSTVIFCNTKQCCGELAVYLQEKGFSADALHGDLEQKDRDQVLVRFANQSCSILVATDVAARGLDIKDLQTVINYELFPRPDVYIHRVGRTGRAGKKGLALSLYEKREQRKLDAISKFQGKSLECKHIDDLPDNPDVALPPLMMTLRISGGRKQKVRPGDILGALTGEAAIAAESVGKIDIFEFWSYVAVKQDVADKALQRLQEGRIKGKTFKVKFI
ncbi:MAG: ATP-dependent RNA helicase DbpA [Deltaproteobacteria bacterium]|nr:ATP-dependent RNA helicase DbpA [Deltaproteobacteria bacterium]